MGLLNYTTKIDPDKTAMEIAQMLSKAGAQAVLTEYDKADSYVTAISFRMSVGDQKDNRTLAEHLSENPSFLLGNGGDPN